MRDDDDLQRRIDDLLEGVADDAAFQSLQDRLKADPAARAAFRERMDLESGLRTWAASDDRFEARPSASRPRSSERDRRRALALALAAVAASLLAIGLWRARPRLDPAPPRPAEPSVATAAGDAPSLDAFLGSLVQPADCSWRQAPRLQGDRFAAGAIDLAAGAAELRFDSGTSLVLEGPCRLAIETADSARLLAGTVFVSVTEVSNGFVLETPEARIIDEGTRYAVARDDQATEVHVFDGSVLWTPTTSADDGEDRILAGQARRYLRGEPGRPLHVPFGQRRFVRRIEAEVREAGEGELFAYDGFENLFGQLRRGRSGFGWAEGWVAAGRGRGPLGEVIDAPADAAFAGRRGGRLLRLQGGESLRRSFAQPIAPTSSEGLFVSLLVRRDAAPGDESSSLQAVLEPPSESPRHVRRRSVSFGVTSDGRPFVNNAGTVRETPITLAVGEPCLLVFRYEARPEGSEASLRAYRTDEPVEATLPSLWSVRGASSPERSDFASIRLSLGAKAQALVDELRVGASWRAVVATDD